MDRRQQKTREAIFAAFTQLLSVKDFSHITVGEIIDAANVGRATFYSHFETKDFLLKELCKELFCHIFDAADKDRKQHRHIFDCDAPESVFLHLFQHLQKNDNNILELLSSQNNGLFLQYFREGLQELVVSQLALFESRKSEKIPEDFWIRHITSTFVETVKWWIASGMHDSPETITEIFLLAV